MTKRQENALKTRQKLIDTAEDLLKANGFNALCVEDITKAAGVAKGTFYVYFKHKEDIVSEICRGYFKEIFSISKKFFYPIFAGNIFFKIFRNLIN